MASCLGPAGMTLLLACVACGGGGGALPPLPPLADAPAGGSTLVLSCEADEMRYPGSPFPAGCAWEISLGRDGALPIVVASEDAGSSCADVRAACEATTGEIAVRSEGGVHRVALAYHGPYPGWATLYLLEPSGQWLQVAREGGAGDAASLLERIPELDAALETELAAELTAGALRRDDGLWEIVADRDVASRHVPALSALARVCRLDEPAARALLAAAPTAPEVVDAVYEGALRESCAPLRAALADAREAASRRIAADLAARQGTVAAADVALGELAAEIGAKELAAPLAARLLLPPPPPLDFNDDALTAWARLGGLVEQLDPGAAIDARLAGLAWSDAPAYTACEMPMEYSQARTYVGYPPGFPVMVATELRSHDTPAVRDALFAIASEPARGGAARQMARILLATWGDPRADRLGDVVLTPCQQERLAGR